MSHPEAWIFFGNHAVSAAPFADNLPGLREQPPAGDDWLVPDEHMLPALQVSLASLGILVATIAAAWAGI